MKIVSLNLHFLSTPRLYATQIAHEGGGGNALVERSEFVLLEARTDNGLTGWGEFSDIDPATFPTAAETARELTGLLLGRDPFDLQALHADLAAAAADQRPHSLWAQAACPLDMLLHDLQGQTAGEPVCKLLGGRRRQAIRVSWVAYIREDLSLLREEVQARAAEGFDAFKLKVGIDIDLDEARLAMLRETTGPQTSIKIDANGGWNLPAALRNIRRLARFDLAGVETPVAGRRPVDLAAVRRQTGVPILEHVNTPREALAYIRHDALDCFNICTTGCGGIGPARQVAELAHAAGLGVLLGSTVEMGPGTLAQLHLAASLAGLSLPSDLIGPGMYREDVLRAPLTYEHGRLHVPDAPGLGIEIDRARLKELASQAWQA